MRPDVTLTASYGTDGKVCEFEIEPRKDLLQNSVANETLSKETVDQLLEEIAPRSTWGKEWIPLGSNVTSGSCNSGITFGDYDNVRASISYGFCSKTVGVHKATVTYKRSACAQFFKPPHDKTQTTPQSKGTP